MDFIKQENTKSSSGASDGHSAMEDQKKKFFLKQTVQITYFVLRVSLAVIILIFVGQNYIEQLLTTNSYARMQENIALWQKDVISEIVAVNSYNCPDGYETYTSYMWPGTKQGCYCSALLSSWKYEKVLEGSCTNLAISAGCTKVDLQDSIAYLFWKKDVLICLKRITNLDFFTNLPQDYNTTVTSCAVGTDYQFDIPSNLSTTYCPVTDMTNDSTQSQQITLAGFSYERQTEYPIVDLRMTEYSFCSDFSKDNISPSKERENNYNLENIVREYCSEVDQRTTEIDQMGEDELIANNPSNFYPNISVGVQSVINLLPAYPAPNSDYKYKLANSGYVRYPQWTYNCRQSPILNLNQASKNFNLDNFRQYTRTCLIFTGVLTFLYGILFTVFYAYRKYSEIKYKLQKECLFLSLEEIRHKNVNLYEIVRKNFWMQFAIFAFKIVIGCCCFIILCVLYFELQSSFQWYMLSQSCTNDYMDLWIETYYSHFLSQQKNVLLNIILILSLVLLDIAIYIWRNYKGDIKSQQNQDDMIDIFGSGDRASQGNSIDGQREQTLENLTEKQFLDNRGSGLDEVENRIYEDEFVLTDEDIVDKKPQKPKRVKNKSKGNNRRKRMMSIEKMDEIQDEF